MLDLNIENGVKENIVLKETPENNIFSYEFNLSGLTPILSEETKEIILYNSKDEAVAAINAPNMNDASLDAYSEDITYQLLKKESIEDTYILHMIVSKEYLEAEDRVYPVTIDPTVSWTGSSKVEDVYVIKGSPYTDLNFYSNDIVVMSAGRSSKGLYRTYMDFTGLDSTIDNKYVESAILTLYETANSNSGKRVQAYQVKEKWNKSTITYSNRAGYYSGTVLSSFKTSGVAGAEKTLDLTSYARSVANGSKDDYGITLRTEDEDSSDTYTQFYSSRHSTTSRRPKLSVVYYDGPTVASSVKLSSTCFKSGTTPTITWEGINSKGLSHIEYRIAQYNTDETEITNSQYTPYSSSTKIGTTASGSATITQIGTLKEGCYRIYVRGVDKGGIVGTGSGITFRVDSIAPKIDSVTINPVTSTTVYSKNATPKIQWKVSDEHLKNIQYSIDGKKTFKQLGTATSGSVAIDSGILTTPGEYTIYLRVEDKAGNRTDSAAVKYYYDNKAPILVSSSITPATNENVYSSERKPTIEWDYTELKMKSVQISVNGASYKEIGTKNAGVAEIPDIDRVGENKIRLKAIDTAGNITENEISSYYYDAYADEIKALTPYSARIEQGVGYANKIVWECNEEIEKGPIFVQYFNVYRDIKEDFIPNEENLVGEKIRNKFWYDIQASSKETNYYKVVAVVADYNGKVVAGSQSSNTVKASPVLLEHFDKRLGINDKYGYLDIMTPSGTGNIEKSTGNFYYAQMDTSLPNAELTYELSRFYNSQSGYSSIFGEGWDFSLNYQLLKKENSADLILKDGTGAFIEFEKNAQGYKQKIGSEYTLVKENKKEIRLYDCDGTSRKEYYDYIITDKDSIEYYFSESGLLLCKTTSSGVFLHFWYNDKGLLSSISTNTSIGAATLGTIIFEYEQELNLVSKVHLPDGTSIGYEYKNNRLNKVAHLSSKNVELISYIYMYNQEGKLDTITDAESNSYVISYGADLKTEGVLYPNGDSYKVDYDTKSNKTVIEKVAKTGATLYEESVVYDTYTGYILESTDAQGLVTRNVYKDGYLFEQETDTSYQVVEDKAVVWKKGKKKTIYQHEDGNLVQIEKSDESGTTTTTYGYDDPNNDNLVTSEKVAYKEADEDKKEIILTDIEYSYDEQGRVKKRIEKSIDSIVDSITEYEYKNSDSEEDLELGQELVVETYIMDGKTLNKVSNKNDTDGSNLYTEEVSGEVDSTGESIKEFEENGYYPDGMGRIKKSVDQDGNIIEYTYDELGREKTIKYTCDSKETQETKTYYPNGQVETETSVDGTTTSYEYDELNRVVSKTVSDGKETKTWTTSYEYGEVTISTGKGSDTSTETISNVYIQTETNPDQKVTSITYTNGKGQVVRKQENGINTDYTYDNSGNPVVCVTSGTIEFRNPEENRKERVTLSLFDENGKQISTIENPIYSDGVFKQDVDKSIVTTNTYDESGNVLTSTDAKGNTVKYEYDSSSRITNVTLQDKKRQNQTSYKYDDVDSDGNIITQTTNARNAISTVKTDGSGRTLETTDKDTEGKDIVVKQSYDKNGNHVKTLYSNNSCEVYSYDSQKRLKTVTSYAKDEDKNSITNITEYQYDKNGNVTSMSDYSVVSSKKTPLRYTGYEYDMLGRKTAEYEIDNTDNPSEVQIKAAKISYTYNSDGALKTAKYSNNSDITELSYIYDPNTGWLKDIKAIIRSGKTATLRSYHYYNDGNVRKMKEYTDILGNTDAYIEKSYTYDALDRVETMVYKDSSGKQVESYCYSYDKNSNITSKNVEYRYSGLKVTENKEYVYNELGQLEKSISTDETGTSTSIVYTYDAVGNRDTMTDNKTLCTTTYQYNQLNQLKSSVTVNNFTKKEISKVAYSYDANGNETSKVDSITGENITYQYDVQNRLIYVSGKKADGTTYTQENRYNGTGQRIYKRDAEIKEKTTIDVTNYYYQNGMVAYTTDESGKLKTFNYYGVDNNVISTTRYNSNGASTYYVYNKDIQGSTTNIIDSTGNSCIGYTYDDFGTTTVYNVKNNLQNEITYTGAIYDSSTGLYYMNARYYDSEIGRFISQDTYRGEKGDAGTWHLYAYCANDPINYVDPSGHFRAKQWWSETKTGVKKLLSKGANGISKVIKVLCRTIVIEQTANSLINLIPYMATFSRLLKAKKSLDWVKNGAGYVRGINEMTVKVLSRAGIKFAMAKVSLGMLKEIVKSLTNLSIGGVIVAVMKRFVKTEIRYEKVHVWSRKKTGIEYFVF